MARNYQEWERIARGISGVLGALYEEKDLIHEVVIYKRMTIRSSAPEPRIVLEIDDPQLALKSLMERSPSLRRKLDPMVRGYDLERWELYLALLYELMAETEINPVFRDRFLEKVEFSSKVELPGARGYLNFVMDNGGSGKLSPETIQKVKVSRVYRYKPEDLESELPPDSWMLPILEELGILQAAGKDPDRELQEFIEEMARNLPEEINKSIINYTYGFLIFGTIGYALLQEGWKPRTPLPKLGNRFWTYYQELVSLVMLAALDIVEVFDQLRFSVLSKYYGISRSLVKLITEVEETVSKLYGDYFYVDLVEFEDSTPVVPSVAYAHFLEEEQEDGTVLLIPRYSVSGIYSGLFSTVAIANYDAMDMFRAYYYLYLHELLHHYRRDLEYYEEAIRKEKEDPEEWPEASSREYGVGEKKVDNLQFDVLINTLVDRLFSGKESSVMSLAFYHNPVFWSEWSEYGRVLVLDSAQPDRVVFSIRPPVWEKKDPSSGKVSIPPLKERRNLTWNKVTTTGDGKIYGKSLEDFMLVLGAASNFLVRVNKSKISGGTDAR